MTALYTGGCTCGAIRYEGTAQPDFSWLCHCRDCQRASGSAFCSVMYVPGSSLKVTGEPHYYTVTAESGRSVSRGFCKNCGSPVFIKAELVPNLQGVWASSLDDPAFFKPVVQVWTGSVQEWGMLHPGLPHLAKAPTADEFGDILARAKSR